MILLLLENESNKYTLEHPKKKLEEMVRLYLCKT